MWRAVLRNKALTADRLSRLAVEKKQMSPNQNESRRYVRRISLLGLDVVQCGNLDWLTLLLLRC